MKDVTRIYRILRLLGTLWYLYPDYRFLQLISIINQEYKRLDIDPFYVEDDTFETVLTTMIMNKENR